MHCAHFPIKHGAAASRRVGEEGRLHPIEGLAGGKGD